jgi:hypothetical protein
MPTQDKTVPETGSGIGGTRMSEAGMSGIGQQTKTRQTDAASQAQATQQTTQEQHPKDKPQMKSQSSAEAGQADIVDDLREQATQVKNTVVEAARARARSAFQHQQERAADAADGVASVLHQAAQKFSEGNQGMVADYTNNAANRIDDFAQNLRQRQLDELVGDIEDYARRQPEIFIGGAFALGFVAARFVKSARARRLGRPSETFGHAI